jgi:hypothetical protein
VNQNSKLCQDLTTKSERPNFYFKLVTTHRMSKNLIGISILLAQFALRR